VKMRMGLSDYADDVIVHAGISKVSILWCLGRSGRLNVVNRIRSTWKTVVFQRSTHLEGSEEKPCRIFSWARCQSRR
jgi:hypothetical protein